VAEDSYASRFMSAIPGGSKKANERMNRTAGADKESLFEAFVVKLLNITSDKFMIKRRSKFLQREYKKKN
jgi:hypothetical protein